MRATPKSICLQRFRNYRGTVKGYTRRGRQINILGNIDLYGDNVHGFLLQVFDENSSFLRGTFDSARGDYAAVSGPGSPFHSLRLNAALSLSLRRFATDMAAYPTVAPCSVAVLRFPTLAWCPRNRHSAFGAASWTYSWKFFLWVCGSTRQGSYGSRGLSRRAELRFCGDFL